MPESFFAVAPTDKPGQRNRIRDPLVPVAVWQLDQAHFAFDSSCLLPTMAADFARLVAEIRARPGALLAIFGHTDPVGDEDYNKALSGRRAKALYGLLTRRVELWEDLYRHPHGHDDWQAGGRVVAMMRDQLSAAGRAVAPSASVREVFDAYLGLLGVDADGKSFGLPKRAFLGGGADDQGKADYQGCGEFNPVVVFSKAEEREFARAEAKAQRDLANAPNRRVTVLLFPPGTQIDRNRWPCPRAGEGPAGCRKRFWSDAVRRRAAGEERRERPVDRTTYACRFYDRLAEDEPGVGMPVALRFVSWLPDPGTRVAVAAGSSADGLPGPLRPGRTVQDGHTTYGVFDLADFRAKGLLDLRPMLLGDPAAERAAPAPGTRPLAPGHRVDPFRLLTVPPSIEQLAKTWGIEIPKIAPAGPVADPGPVDVRLTEFFEEFENPGLPDTRHPPTPGHEFP